MSAFSSWKECDPSIKVGSVVCVIGGLYIAKQSIDCYLAGDIGDALLNGATSIFGLIAAPGFVWAAPRRHTRRQEASKEASRLVS